jgi:selenocysteine lyase/cysteine desulfurase
MHGSYYGLPLRLARCARRFDTSPAWFSWIGTAPALEVIEQIGIDRIHGHNVALANRFAPGWAWADCNSAIVSAAIPGAEGVLAAAGIRAAARAGNLRVSFHVYSTEDDVDTALDALRDCAPHQR